MPTQFKYVPCLLRRNNKETLKPFFLHGMRGFTLVEMAIVLAIIGLIMGSVLAMTKTLTTSSRIASTQTKENIIKSALINFIATNNRLPCPADPAALSLPPAGTEAITTGVCNATLSAFGSGSSAVVSGVVPWVTLGLTQDTATDGYYNFFTYQVTLTATKTTANSAAGSGIQTISGLTGAISIFSATPVQPATSLTSLGNQINYCTQPNTSYNPCAAIAIIVSYGADGYGAYSSSGQINPPPTGYTDEIENSNGDSNFVIKGFSNSSTNPFGDILLPLTSNDLLSPLIFNGTVQTYSAVLNNDFANITAAIIASAVNTRCCAPGSYVYTILTPSSPTYDPWGNQIILGNNIVSISSSTPASSVAFTLTSDGPDGVPGNSDNVTNTIHVNQLQQAFGNVGW